MPADRAGDLELADRPGPETVRDGCDLHAVAAPSERLERDGSALRDDRAERVDQQRERTVPRRVGVRGRGDPIGDGLLAHEDARQVHPLPVDLDLTACAREAQGDPPAAFIAGPGRDPHEVALEDRDEAARLAPAGADRAPPRDAVRVPLFEGLGRLGLRDLARRALDPLRGHHGRRRLFEVHARDGLVAVDRRSRAVRPSGEVHLHVALLDPRGAQARLGRVDRLGERAVRARGLGLLEVPATPGDDRPDEPRARGEVREPARRGPVEADLRDRRHARLRVRVRCARRSWSRAARRCIDSRLSSTCWTARGIPPLCSSIWSTASRWSRAVNRPA